MLRRKSAHVIWWKKNQLAAGVHKIDESTYPRVLLYPSRIANICFFSGLRGYRRMPPARYCPLEHVSPRFLQPVICSSWLCPPPSGLAVGWGYVEIKRLSWHQPTVVWPRRDATFHGMANMSILLVVCVSSETCACLMMKKNCFRIHYYLCMNRANHNLLVTVDG